MAGDCTEGGFIGAKSCFIITVLLWWASAGRPRLWQMQVLVEVSGAGPGLTPNRAPLSSRGTDPHASPQPGHCGRIAWLEEECLGHSSPLMDQGCRAAGEVGHGASFSPPSGQWIRIPLKINFLGCMFEWCPLDYTADPSPL